jgi:formylglycine-generating enzyme required for sulfatase activity
MTNSSDRKLEATMRSPSAKKLLLGILVLHLAAAAQVPFYSAANPYQAAFDSVEAVRRQMETAEALGRPAIDTIWLPGGVAVEMRICTAGKFLLGSPDTEDGHEQGEYLRPVVFPKPFYVSTYALTQEQYRALMDTLPDGTTEYRPDYAVRVHYWHMKNDLIPALQAYAPPDWEFACMNTWQMEYATRAGTLTKWYTGEDEAEFAQAAWYRDNSGGQEHPVGQKRPNAWGFHDMLGNVWQWVVGVTPGYDTRTDSTHAVKGGDYRAAAGGNGCRSANVMIQDIPSGVRLVMNCTLDIPTTAAVPWSAIRTSRASVCRVQTGALVVTPRRGDRSVEVFSYNGRRVHKATVAPHGLTVVKPHTSGAGVVVLHGQERRSASSLVWLVESASR